MKNAFLKTLIVFGFSLVVSLPVLAAPPHAIEVDVERTKIKKQKLATLKFLNANKDFIRGRLDALRESVKEDGWSQEVDARYFRYHQMIADMQAKKDSVAALEDSVTREELMESILELAEVLETLDAIEGALDESQARLEQLEADFVERQKTALVVLISGELPEMHPEGFVLTNEYGDSTTVTLNTARTAVLESGGVAELLHNFVEARPQTWEIHLQGLGWEHEPVASLRIHPAPNDITFLELDLTEVLA
ncbi:MAG: hypothetical protein HKN21_07065, partial [Candidatus Eisenbacteria bacterium]|nr:hypothetical protein [Candidatus Eisenbacteria bacterium]